MVLKHFNTIFMFTINPHKFHKKNKNITKM